MTSDSIGCHSLLIINSLEYRCPLVMSSTFQVIVRKLDMMTMHMIPTIRRLG